MTGFYAMKFIKELALFFFCNAHPGIYYRDSKIFFICAACTDVIDGFLARYLNQRTFLGACLDPVADKIFLFSVFCTLFFIKSDLFYIPAWFVCIMLIKELLQIIGAIILYRKSDLVAIEANVYGKISTVIQIMFVVWLFWSYFLQKLPDSTIYNGFLFIMSFCMGISFLHYSFIWIHRLQQKRG